MATVNQRVLSLLARFSDREFYERQVARQIGIAYGSANRSLNELYATNAIKRRREGKMWFYRVDLSSAGISEYKKLVNIVLLDPLVEELKKTANQVVLYGSCARGEDTSESDFDLFIVTNSKERVRQALDRFTLPRGYEELRVQPVVHTPLELLVAGASQRAFLDEVERGIVLWAKAAVESRV